MSSVLDMLWVELRKVLRSRMPLWTVFGALFMPLGIAFLIFVSRNPEVSQRLGLVSAKANLVAYAATDWAMYLVFFGQLVAAGGFLLFTIIVSWVFGREFSDGTVKDLLAVPVGRWSILLAKFLVVVLWSVVLTIIIFVFGLVLGALMQLPGGAFGVFVRGGVRVAITAGLVLGVVFPFAFFASVGRGYLLPIGVALFMLMLTNLAVVVGWGDFFPWGVPSLYAQGRSVLLPISYWIVVLTGLVGVVATYGWWMSADQCR